MVLDKENDTTIYFMHRWRTIRIRSICF